MYLYSVLVVVIGYFGFAVISFRDGHHILAGALLVASIASAVTGTLLIRRFGINGDKKKIGEL